MSNQHCQRDLVIVAVAKSVQALIATGAVKPTGKSPCRLPMHRTLANQPCRRYVAEDLESAAQDGSLRQHLCEDVLYLTDSLQYFVVAALNSILRVYDRDGIRKQLLAR